MGRGAVPAVGVDCSKTCFVGGYPTTFQVNSSSLKLPNDGGKIGLNGWRGFECYWNKVKEVFLVGLPKVYRARTNILYCTCIRRIAVIIKSL